MTDNPLVLALEELCAFLSRADIDYMLVGGLAVGIWAEPRSTVDVDFLISFKLEDLPRLRGKLEESGAFTHIHEKPMIFQRVSLLRAMLKSNPDIFVDFLFADDDFKREALSRSIIVVVHGFPVSIPTPEDLILLKRLSGRQQDFLDAKKIALFKKDELNQEYIEKWENKLGLPRLEL